MSTSSLGNLGNIILLAMFLFLVFGAIYTNAFGYAADSIRDVLNIERNDYTSEDLDTFELRERQIEEFNRFYEDLQLLSNAQSFCFAPVRRPDLSGYQITYSVGAAGQSRGIQLSREDNILTQIRDPGLGPCMIINDDAQTLYDFIISGEGDENTIRFSAVESLNLRTRGNTISIHFQGHPYETNTEEYLFVFKDQNRACFLPVYDRINWPFASCGVPRTRTLGGDFTSLFDTLCLQNIMDWSRNNPDMVCEGFQNRVGGGEDE